jgi:SAM-dependent methyltransferase
VTREGNLYETKEVLEGLLKESVKDVKPPDYMIKFYNFIGSLPIRLGVIIFLFTGIDTIKVAIKAMQNRTDAAIQVLYHYRFRPWRLWWGLGDHLWQMAYNCRSVRARGVFTRKAIKFLLQVMSKRKEKIRVASLGSGSGSQMLQGIAENNLKINELHLSLVDNDSRALELGRKNARNLGIEDLIDTYEASIGRFLKKAEEESFDLIEKVGLSDYFDDTKLQRYLSEIHRVLSSGGYFLGANISSKEEASYAHNVACWPEMFYRERNNIVELLESIGFKKIWIGECGLYTFWIVQKD